MSKIKATVRLPDGREVSVPPIDTSKHGLIVVSGPQGAGKTTLRNALAFASGDRGANMPEGSVVTLEANGEKVSISNQHRHVGSFPLAHVGGDAIWGLVDSGHKTAAARGKSRVEALLSLVTVDDTMAPKLISQVLPSEDLVAQVLQSKEIVSLGERWSTSYKDFIGRVTRAAQGLARTLEAEVEEKRQAHNACRDVILGSGFVETFSETEIQNAQKGLLDVAEIYLEQHDPVMFLKNNIEELIRAVAKSDIVIEEKTKAKQRVEEALESSARYTEEDLAKARDDVRALKASVAEKKARLIDLQSSLMAEERELEACKIRGKRILAHLAKEEEARSNSGLEKEIEKERKFREAAAVQLEDLETRILPRVKAYLLIEQAYKDLQEAKAAKLKAQRESKAVRELTKDSVFRVDIKESLDVNAVRIGESDVEVMFNDKWTPLEEMSEGERVKSVFDILARVVEDRVVFVDRAVFTSLSPENRRIVIDELKSRKMLGITEIPTDEEGIAITQFETGDNYHAST